MRPPALLALLLVAVLPAQQPSAQGRSLQVRDLFLLDYLLVAGLEDPVAWIDAERYLVFDAGRPGADAPKGFYAVAARTGNREAWLDGRKAAAALASASGLPPAKVAAELADADHYAWSGDHASCVVTLGGDLFAVGRDGAAVRLTSLPGPEQEPSFAPDGRTVAFVHAGDLHVVPAAGGEVRALTKGGGEELLHGRLDWVYQEEVYGRGKWRAYWWSPDGSRIALLRLDERNVPRFTLVSDVPAQPEVEVVRYPKAGDPNPVASVGVVAVAGGEPVWFDLARHAAEQPLVVRVTWAPDGREVFFQVTDRQQTWLAMTAGDPTTGASRQVFREESDCWVEPGPEPRWLRGGREFLWLSERDGFRHVYRYSRDGELMGRLTAGDFNVLELEAIDEGAGLLWFTADKADSKGAQLFTAPLAGGEPRQVTSGGGTHEVELAPGNAMFLSRWSNATTAKVVTVRDAAGAMVREVASSRAEVAAPFRLQAPEFVQIPARDGFVMEAMLFRPRDFVADKRYPMVQNLYAGPHTPAVNDAWAGRDFLWHQMLAQRGYLVLVCDNRSASGKGRKWHKACWRNLGATELQDLEDGARWAVEQGLADPDRLALWGWSYGGYQTCYNLTHSKLWKAGIAVNAVTDWRLYDSIYTERYLGLPASNAEGYDRSSAVRSAAGLEGRLMLVAAALDDNVHLQNSLQFLHALQFAGKDCDFMVYPRVRHGIETLEQQMHLFHRMLRFLERNL